MAMSCGIGTSTTNRHARGLRSGSDDEEAEMRTLFQIEYIIGEGWVATHSYYESLSWIEDDDPQRALHGLIKIMREEGMEWA